MPKTKIYKPRKSLTVRVDEELHLSILKRIEELKLKSISPYIENLIREDLIRSEVEKKLGGKK